MRCPACGYVQLPGAHCKRCRRHLQTSLTPVSPPLAETKFASAMGNDVKQRIMSPPLSGRGRIVRRSIVLYRENFLPLTFFGGLLSIVSFVGPSLAALPQGRYQTMYWIVAIVTIVASTMVSTICLIWSCFEALLNRQISIAAALHQASFKNLLRCLWAGVVAGAVVIVGLLAILVPGLFLAARLSMVLPVVVVEGKGGWQAIVRSWQLVRGRTLRVFGLLMLITFAPLVIPDVIKAAARLLPYPPLALEPFASITTIVTVICTILLWTFSEVGITVLYSDLAY